MSVPITVMEDNGFDNAGAVYVFTKPNGVWKQTAFIKAYNTDINDFLGNSVSLSSDGYTLAVGVSGEDSSTKGIWVDELALQFIDNLATDSGAVYVFNRNFAGTWAQQAYIKPTVNISRYFGSTVVLNKDETLVSDGNTLAVSLRDIGGTIGGVSAAIVFNRVGTVWSEQALIKKNNSATNLNGDKFGDSLALDSSGDLLVVGAPLESSDTPGINGIPNENAIGSGAVFTFIRTLKKWTEKTYIKTINPKASDNFGVSVSISGDGKTIAVGADIEKNSEGATYLY